MNATSEAILGACHPVLIERVHNLAAALEAEGYDPHLSAGLRTISQQNSLYDQGRTAPGAIVTDAKGAADNHVMGFAADFFFETNGDADWASPGFARLAAQAATYGLRSGACFKKLPDQPHVELEEFPEVPTPYMQQVYLASGSVTEVWREFPIPNGESAT